MTGRICTLDGCGRPHEARGLCAKHYLYALRHKEFVSNPPVVLAGETIEEKLRLNHRVDPESGCWRWLGTHDDRGYGRFASKGVHRLAYELWVGPIPDGLHLDHVRARGCVHRDCLNPDHLEPVTPSENTLRARAATTLLRAATTVRPECGTTTGYRLHLRHREQTCKPCRDANAAYARTWLAKRSGVAS